MIASKDCYSMLYEHAAFDKLILLSQFHAVETFQRCFVLFQHATGGQCILSSSIYNENEYEILNAI